MVDNKTEGKTIIFFSINLRPVGSLNPLQQARGRDKENALELLMNERTNHQTHKHCKLFLFVIMQFLHLDFRTLELNLTLL